MLAVSNLSPQYKRGDLWVNSVQTFLQVIFFYNPFVWFAIRLEGANWWRICTCSPLLKKRFRTSDTSNSQRYRAFLSLRLLITGNCQVYRSELNHSFVRRVRTQKKAYIKTFGWTSVLVTKRQDFWTC